MQCLRIYEATAVFIPIALVFSLFAHPQTSPSQETEQRPNIAGNPRVISQATEQFQNSVNGKSSVKERCQLQGKDIQVEETSEVLERRGCGLVLRTRKVSRSSEGQKQLEFTVYADLKELTTPVLVEKQSFAQCHPVGSVVLKVSSRSQPGKALQLQRSETDSTAKAGQVEKQTRRDLSLFFADAGAANRAAKALDRAVTACGGNEWPDEDDLP
jgi:hypothetical protein